jgi:hypothetical protein
MRLHYSMPMVSPCSRYGAMVVGYGALVEVVVHDDVLSAVVCASSAGLAGAA